MSKPESFPALEREWLETDGRGGYAAGTVALAITRPYHAILGPALRPPLGRMVLWATSEETLFLGGRECPLFTHVFSGLTHPRGYEHLDRFLARPWPRWVYRFPGASLERELFLGRGGGDAYLGFTWRGSEAVTLRLRPLLAFVDHHTASRRGTGTVGRMDIRGPGRAAFRLRGESPVLHLHVPEARVVEDPVWVENLVLPVETGRGLPDRADLWRPGGFLTVLPPGQTVWIRAGLTEAGSEPVEDVASRERQRRHALDLPFLGAVPGLSPLALAADQFVVRRGDKATVIAGYPWFTDWGRDTMIALPGLALATGRYALARELLLTFAGHLQDGLIPNRFPDEGDIPEYNTVDATLWMAVALRATWKATGDDDLARLLLETLREARRWHERGTRHGIRVTADGLLRAGEPGFQLTWMDAKVDGWVVTPRMGKPVEIQALWYNFLRVGEELETHVGGDPGPWGASAERVRTAFLPAFWDAARGYLADVVADDGTRDLAFRPNQIFALSLPFPLVDAAHAASILTQVREKLVTPRGLRSLDPNHPDYHPRYAGNRRNRDAAYHQGTVWGWLHGPYLDALRRYGGSPGAREARGVLEGWVGHLREGCIGQAAEVFDAEPPYREGGCFAQAWTVAEILRAARSVYGNETGIEEPLV